MEKIAISLSIVLIFGSCGVETNSSTKKSESSIVDDGSTVISGNTDTNSSDVFDKNDTRDDGDNTPIDTPSSSSNFNMKDATFDKQACSIENGYNVLSDSSFDPNATPDDDNGIEIESRYAYNTDVEATKIYIFYPKLTQEIKSRNVNVYSENYRFGFDEAWIANSHTVYVRLAKDGIGHYSCYRYELSSLTGSAIMGTKVYR